MPLTAQKTEQRQFGNNPFAVPHDAASTVGYVFKSGGSKCTYLTDVGFVTDEVRQNIADADVVVLEANHDEDMLKNGSYPQILKQRILGTRGHLSNVSAAWLLAHMERLPEEVFLAHLSQENPICLPWPCKRCGVFWTLTKLARIQKFISHRRKT